jgi:hypothetical protein
MLTLPIYVSTSKEKERPSFSKTECCSSLHTLNIPEPRKKSNRRNKNKKPKQMESARVITAVPREQDHQLNSPYLLKRDNPGVPTIECTINRSSFQKTIYDTRSGINIMAKVTYEYLYGTIPLDPTYA